MRNWPTTLNGILFLLVLASGGLSGCFLSGAPGDGPPVPIIFASPTPGATAAPSATPPPSIDEPVGFPLDVSLRPMRATVTVNGATVVPAASNGPTVVDVARDLHPRKENDWQANEYGWNCRVHTTYEGAPGVDWYLRDGTPVVATMRGQAELYIITTANSFQYYGVDNRIMLGLPSPNVPINPLPGPNGGLGVFVSISNGKLRAEYGHLNPAQTLALMPKNAFVAPYSPDYNYSSAFGRPRNFYEITVIARWPVERGDVVGKVGNTGYSDVAHLHYQVVTEDRKTKYCLTVEAFPGAGWLFARPADLP